jgi:2-polyprenyl-6-methoxyphenol hydroxylase-like FAD-dependent oxidoreductase
VSRAWLRERGRIAGVCYLDRIDHTEHQLCANLTLACDGRSSTVRTAAGLMPRSFGVPIDVWWFRLRGAPTIPAAASGGSPAASSSA